MRKILVVDDDEDILNLVKGLLCKQGFEVTTHSNGKNVMDVVKWNYPHLILLDIRFFGKFGTDICKELKEKYTIPVILVSADTEKGRQFASFNADGFIEKPFNIKHLLDTINQHLN